MTTCRRRVWQRRIRVGLVSLAFWPGVCRSRDFRTYMEVIYNLLGTSLWLHCYEIGDRMIVLNQVIDVDPPSTTLGQHWVNISCLVGFLLMYSNKWKPWQPLKLWRHVYWLYRLKCRDDSPAEYNSNLSCLLELVDIMLISSVFTGWVFTAHLSAYLTNGSHLLEFTCLLSLNMLSVALRPDDLFYYHTPMKYMMSWSCNLKTLINSA